MPPGMWRLALRAAAETRRAPLWWCGVGTTAVQTRHGRLYLRIARRPAAGTPPVVLVHGVIVSSRYFLPLAAALRDLGVLVPDLPGFGLSAAARPVTDVGGLADALLACVSAAGHDRIFLVGNSFGAQIAVEAAIRAPERVERLVLVGPTVDPAARTLLRQYVRWQRNAPDEHLSVLPVMARDVADLGLVRATALLRAMLEHRMEERLPLVRPPTLVVRAGRDRVVPDRWAQDAAAMLPDGRLAVLPGYAHMPHWSGALALAPIVRDFLMPPMPADHSDHPAARP